MKKIIVPIDFSPCSIQALKYAIGLSKLSGRSLLITHAIQVPALVGPEVELGSELEVETKEQFEQLVKEVPQLAEIDYTTEYSFDLLLTNLKKLRKQTDFIVMGTTGATGLKEILFGSNTYEVIQQLALPVIAVPENLGSIEIGSIAFASDYKQINNLKDIEVLIELAKLRNSEVHILHIGEENNISREELAAGKHQDQFFKSVRHSYHFIHGIDVKEEIERYITSNSIKLLAVYARKHDLLDDIFHRSITKDFTHHTNVPLLVIPEL